jgi:TPR repeat protein
VEAYRWFYKAAGLGSPLGARVLALMHKLALGGASDGDAGFSHWLNHALLLQRKQVLPDTAILFAGDSICLSRRVDAGDWFKDAAISGDLVALHRLKWAIKLGLNSSYPVVASSNERLPKCA